MIKVFFKDEEVAIKKGDTLREFTAQFKIFDPGLAVAAEVNGVMVDFDTVLEQGDKIALYNFTDAKGKEVFWHTSAHVLAQAILRLYPDAKPTIGPPLENDGFYYDFADLTINEEDFPKIEKEIEAILKENYKPKREVVPSKANALERFKQNKYKCEMIEALDGIITAYDQGGFVDLCRGPHLPSLGKIKAFKLLKVAGAYWRGDQSREMLTRVYGISFPEKSLLKEYLHQLEEAKKRDHKKLGPELGLFLLMEEAPGIPFILPKGMIIWNRLIEMWRSMHKKAGYEEIKTPQLMTRELWERSGHWHHYKENMYTLSIEERDFAVKPMNCPGCMLYYGSTNHSYRELPLRIAEFGHVHRYESSGSISGLSRVRGFHQDDAHIFIRPEQIEEEVLAVLKLVEQTYSIFGLTYRFEFSTRPEKSFGTDEQWALATKALQGALDSSKVPYRINEGDGAFYGPKIDIHIKDAIGRSWQCGTVQLDVQLPEKFNLTYKDSDGIDKTPVLIHRAIFGSIERFLGQLIEHFAGKFPLWLSPRQVRILTVADRHIDYANTIAARLQDRGFECEVDLDSESIGKKVRTAQLLQVNYILTVGDKELESQTLSVRGRDNVVYGQFPIDSFIETIERERADLALVTYYTKN